MDDRQAELPAQHGGALALQQSDGTRVLAALEKALSIAKQSKNLRLEMRRTIGNLEKAVSHLILAKNYTYHTPPTARSSGTRWQGRIVDAVNLVKLPDSDAQRIEACVIGHMTDRGKTLCS
ncbi:MAG: hypothetical protein CMN78_02015 [Spirochaetales bacterium]|nr:hypothetical protein [Spirochaetales bacterium]